MRGLYRKVDRAVLFAKFGNPSFQGPAFAFILFEAEEEDSMVTIQSIYEQQKKLQNPANSECEQDVAAAEPESESIRNWKPDMKRIYEIMSRRFEEGPIDGAERHNEHQP